MERDIHVRELMLEANLPKVMKEQRYLVQNQLTLAVVQDVVVAETCQPGGKH